MKLYVIGYIVRAKYKCPYCKRNTSVIAFAVQNYFEVEVKRNGKVKSWEYHDKYIRFITRENEIMFASKCQEEINYRRFESYLKKGLDFIIMILRGELVIMQITVGNVE